MAGLMWSVCGQLSGWGQEVQAQAVSERALVPMSAYIFGYSRNACRLILTWVFWVATEGNVFLLEGRQSAAL